MHVRHPSPLGVPGAVELALLVLVLLVVAALVGRWISRDARASGSDWAWQWSTGIFPLFLLGKIPAWLDWDYMAMCGGKRRGKPTREALRDLPTRPDHR